MENSHQSNMQQSQPQIPTFSPSQQFSSVPQIKTEASGASQAPIIAPKIVRKFTQIGLDKLKKIGITATLKQAIEKSKATKPVESKIEKVFHIPTNDSTLTTYTCADATQQYNSSYEDTLYDSSFPMSQSPRVGPMVVSYYLPPSTNTRFVQSDDTKKIQVLSVKNLSSDKEKIDLNRILDTKKPAPNANNSSEVSLDGSATGFAKEFDNFRMTNNIHYAPTLTKAAKPPVYIQNLDNNHIMESEYQSPKHVHNYGTIDVQSNTFYTNPFQTTLSRSMSFNSSTVTTNRYDEEFLRPQLPATRSQPFTPPPALQPTEVTPPPPTKTYSVKVVQPDLSRPLLQMNNIQSSTPKVLNSTLSLPPTTGPIILTRVPKPNFTFTTAEKKANDEEIALRALERLQMDKPKIEKRYLYNGKVYQNPQSTLKTTMVVHSSIDPLQVPATSPMFRPFQPRVREKMTIDKALLDDNMEFEGFDEDTTRKSKIRSLARLKKLNKGINRLKGRYLRKSPDYPNLKADKPKLVAMEKPPIVPPMRSHEQITAELKEKILKTYEKKQQEIEKSRSAISYPLTPSPTVKEEDSLQNENVDDRYVLYEIRELQENCETRTEEEKIQSSHSALFETNEILKPTSKIVKIMNPLELRKCLETINQRQSVIKMNENIQDSVPCSKNELEATSESTTNKSDATKCSKISTIETPDADSNKQKQSPLKSCLKNVTIFKALESQIKPDIPTKLNTNASVIIAPTNEVEDLSKIQDSIDLPEDHFATKEATQIKLALPEVSIKHIESKSVSVLPSSRRRIMKIKPAVIAKIMEGKKSAPSVAEKMQNKVEPAASDSLPLIEPAIISPTPIVEPIPINLTEIKDETETTGTSFIWKKHRQVKEAPQKPTDRSEIPVAPHINMFNIISVLEPDLSTSTQITPCDNSTALSFDNEDNQTGEDNNDEQMEYDNSFYAARDDSYSADNSESNSTFTEMFCDNANTTIPGTPPQASSSVSHLSMNIDSTPFQQLLETLKNVSGVKHETKEVKSPVASTSSLAKSKNEKELLGVIQLLLQHVNPLALNQTIISKSIKTEQQLPDSSTQYQTVFESSHDTSVIDLETDKRQPLISVPRPKFEIIKHEIVPVPNQIKLTPPDPIEVINECIVPAPIQETVAIIKSESANDVTNSGMIDSFESKTLEEDFDESHFDDASLGSNSEGADDQNIPLPNLDEFELIDRLFGKQKHEVNGITSLQNSTEEVKVVEKNEVVVGAMTPPPRPLFKRIKAVPVVVKNLQRQSKTSTPKNIVRLNSRASQIVKMAMQKTEASKVEVKLTSNIADDPKVLPAPEKIIQSDVLKETMVAEKITSLKSPRKVEESNSKITDTCKSIEYVRSSIFQSVKVSFESKQKPSVSGSVKVLVEKDNSEQNVEEKVTPKIVEKVNEIEKEDKKTTNDEINEKVNHQKSTTQSDKKEEHEPIENRNELLNTIKNPTKQIELIENDTTESIIIKPVDDEVSLDNFMDISPDTSQSSFGEALKSKDSQKDVSTNDLFNQLRTEIAEKSGKMSPILVKNIRSLRSNTTTLREKSPEISIKIPHKSQPSRMSFLEVSSKESCNKERDHSEDDCKELVPVTSQEELSKRQRTRSLRSNAPSCGQEKKTPLSSSDHFGDEQVKFVKNISTPALIETKLSIKLSSQEESSQESTKQESTKQEPTKQEPTRQSRSLRSSNVAEKNKLNQFEDKYKEQTTHSERDHSVDSLEKSTITSLDESSQESTKFTRRTRSLRSNTSSREPSVEKLISASSSKIIKMAKTPLEKVRRSLRSEDRSPELLLEKITQPEVLVSQITSESKESEIPAIDEQKNIQQDEKKKDRRKSLRSHKLETSAPEFVESEENSQIHLEEDVQPVETENLLDSTLPTLAVEEPKLSTKRISAKLRTKTITNAQRPESGNNSLGSESKDSGDFEGFDASITNDDESVKRLQMMQEIQNILRLETQDTTSDSEHDSDTNKRKRRRETALPAKKRRVIFSDSEDDKPLKPTSKSRTKGSDEVSPPKIPSITIKLSPNASDRHGKRTISDYFVSTKSEKRTRSRTPESTAVRAKSRRIENADVSEDTTYTCSNCKLKVSKREWLKHYKFHNGAAGRVGIDPEIDFSVRINVVNAIQNFIKTGQTFGFAKCEKCPEKKRSAVGLQAHMDICGLTPAEIDKLKVMCQHCQKRMSQVSLASHLRGFCQTLKAKDAMAKELERKEEEPETEELTDSGRVKRGARKKAERKIKTVIAKQTDDAVKEFILTTNVAFVTSENRKLWYTELQKHKIAKCLNHPNCKFESKMITDLVDHWPICEHRSSNFYCCTLCPDFQSPNQSMTAKHVRTAHNIGPDNDFEASGSEASMGDESEDDDGSSGDEEVSDKSVAEESDEEKTISLRNLGKAKNKRKSGGKEPVVSLRQVTLGVPCLDLQRAVLAPIANELKHHKYYFHDINRNWTTAYRTVNYSTDPLFPELKNQTNDLHFLSETESACYRPTITESVRFAREERKTYSLMNTSLKNDEWERLDIFKSTIHAGIATMFCGGSITAMDWATFPLDYNGPHFLAVSCKHPDQYMRLCKTELTKCLIQIWKFDNMSNKKKLSKPELYYSIAYDQGPIQELKFCPSGGYSEPLNRLGLLAITTATGNVVIYALPHQVPSAAVPYVITLIPTMILTIDRSSNGSDVASTRITWTKDKYHTIIAAGFSNGLVAIWNLESSSPLLKFVENEITCLLPIHVMPAHQSAVTAVKLHHVNNTRYLMTCSLDRKAKVFDLDSSFVPLEISSSVIKSRILAADWNLNWSSFQIGLDESLAAERGGMFLKQPHDIGDRTELLLHAESSIYDISCNEWTNNCLAVTESGDICGLTSMQMLSNVNGKDVWENRLFYGYTDVVQLNTSENNFSFTETYNDDHGVVFCDIETPKNSMKDSNVKKTRQRSMCVYPFNRINRIRCNPNAEQFQYYAVGYQAGFVRVKKLFLHS